MTAVFQCLLLVSQWHQSNYLDSWSFHSISHITVKGEAGLWPRIKFDARKGSETC